MDSNALKPCRDWPRPSLSRPTSTKPPIPGGFSFTGACNGPPSLTRECSPSPGTKTRTTRCTSTLLGDLHVAAHLRYRHHWLCHFDPGPSHAELARLDLIIKRISRPCLLIPTTPVCHALGGFFFARSTLSRPEKERPPIGASFLGWGQWRAKTSKGGAFNRRDCGALKGT
jgi:hypothetical protein